MRYQDLLDKKITEEEIKQDDYNYNASMNPKGKSSKYVRDVIIPELLAKARYYKNLHTSIKVNNEKKVEVRKEINKKKRKEVFIAKKKHYGKAQTKINLRAMEMYFQKIKLRHLDRSNYLDGALSYPIIRAWLKLNTALTEPEFSVLMVVYCHKWMTIKEGEYFGFETINFRKLLAKLYEKGFVTFVTVNRKKSYTSTEKAYRYMFKYMIYNRRRMVILFRELDKKQPKVTGNNWLRYHDKFLNQIDVYEETNLIGLDEGAD